ncbi:hypothetical protein THII_3367 [Thioploca ingrica]|uniref:GmrSD restriction endonucleases N-terminal domain-containing protein n=1 Tax=Thioploca ingrica TaxID=40754 RepID=A0A090AJL4_9GAMM|nr:hypothetical protein THII_3367 [Thioploca ingrica]
MITLDNINTSNNWFEDDDDDDNSDDFQIDEYDLTSTPNDFNVKTIFDYLEAGVIKIPLFQRNYVWDLIQASKLIESLILGLPIPQIFLYEKGRNQLLVIDGQQRLLSIYYFIKQRFPKKDKRVELRQIFDQHGHLPEETLKNDDYFTEFKLKLPENLPDRRNKFNGLTYTTLGDYQFQFELRPIRNIFVKQNSPKDDNSSIYEIFNRLNSGGTNLNQPEIRVTLYHSEFYKMLYRINSLPEWRRLLGQPEPTLHMEDVEILLRSFAFLIESDKYTPPLKKFLNQFAKKCQSHTTEQNQYLEMLFKTFLAACEELPDDIFFRRKISIALFEAIFTVTCQSAFHKQQLPNIKLSQDKIKQLKNDNPFINTLRRGGTLSKTNVTERLQRATEIMQVP